jgi:hypothetical protein
MVPLLQLQTSRALRLLLLLLLMAILPVASSAVMSR